MVVAGRLGRYTDSERPRGSTLGAEGFSLFSLLAKSIPIDEACFSFLSLQEPSEATSSTAAKDGSRMMELERRIAQLELNREYKSDKRAVMELEVDMLAKLRTIREEVAKGGAGGGTSLKEADALKVEVERLRSCGVREELALVWRGRSSMTVP